jgi:phosphoglycolate phosphatase-like HAD superfamily hydrolase
VEASFPSRPHISHVVFDFDGTLSWLRHGWPRMMAELFLKHVPTHEAQRLQGILLDDILGLNGKSSIFQMEQCARRLVENGGPRLDPGKVLAEYQNVLQAVVRERTAKLRGGEAQPDEFVVHGARVLLQLLQARKLALIILSGTVEPQVKQEAALLGLAPFFGRHIYGGTADLVQSSKQAILERLLREEGISGERLLAFGDGPVELQITKAAGGLAVGVASDEEQNGSGALHAQKLPLLREAGADLVIADYREPERLIRRIFGE